MNERVQALAGSIYEEFEQVPGDFEQIGRLLPTYGTEIDENTKQQHLVVVLYRYDIFFYLL